jgi:hypothetical protein
MRPSDDPQAIHRHDLHPQLTSVADRVSEKWSRESGRPAPAINLIVVIWGRFQDEIIHDQDVTYVTGEKLTEYLRLAKAS